MIWDELTSPQIAELDKQIPVVLVLSATEQHGPHLPLATDRLIGEHFARVLHETLPDKVLVLPSVSIGCSSHHMDFPGSLTVGHNTFIHPVEEIVESVMAHGFTNILMLNSHGWNQGVGQVLVEKLGIKHPESNIVLATWWRITADLKALNESGKGGTGHACEFETSLVLLMAPHLVHMDKLAKGAHNDTFPWAEGDMLNAPKVSYFRTMREMTSNGVYGDPSFASKEKGELITKLVVEHLKGIINDLLNPWKSNFDFPIEDDNYGVRFSPLVNP